MLDLKTMTAGLDLRALYEKLKRVSEEREKAEEEHEHSARAALRLEQEEREAYERKRAAEREVLRWGLPPVGSILAAETAKAAAARAAEIQRAIAVLGYAQTLRTPFPISAIFPTLTPASAPKPKPEDQIASEPILDDWPEGY